MWEISPNPGKIRIYTSGCPKNQNKCWYKIGSPPPAGSKKEVLKFRSVKSIVIAPANTGKDSKSRMAVINTDQINSGIRSKDKVLDRIFKIVVIKLIAPKIEDTPAKWREKIIKSIDEPPWNIWLERGGYTVHPVPAPISVKEDISNKDKEGGSNQNLMLFMRGNAISGAPIIIGTNQFPNPPIIIGMTIKKIITNACAVTRTLKIWSFCPIILGWESLSRIIILIEAPNNPAHRPKPKYIVPMSLWFVEYIHRINICLSCKLNVVW